MSNPATSTGPRLHPTLASYVARVVDRLEQVPDERRRVLDELASFIAAKRRAHEPAKLVFICTHNSRRSHMSQLWAAVAAAYYGVEGVETFSGGTEATAFEPRAVAAMTRAGMRIDARNPEEDNPRYGVTFAPDGAALEAFSKKYGDPPNPTDDFAAVMTCGHADEHCPVISGATLRVALPYEDPKDADGTPREEATYDARSREIATEMFYIFSRVQV